MSEIFSRPDNKGFRVTDADLKLLDDIASGKLSPLQSPAPGTRVVSDPQVVSLQNSCFTALEKLTGTPMGAGSVMQGSEPTPSQTNGQWGLGTMRCLAEVVRERLSNPEFQKFWQSQKNLGNPIATKCTEPGPKNSEALLGHEVGKCEAAELAAIVRGEIKSSPWEGTIVEQAMNFARQIWERLRG